jgi:hypothetical protein
VPVPPRARRRFLSHPAGYLQKNGALGVIQQFTFHISELIDGVYFYNGIAYDGCVKKEGEHVPHRYE